MIMELQVLPVPAGTATDRYRNIDAAIALVAASGLPYEVGALGTCVEGPADAIWELARAAHEAALGSDVGSCVTVIKIADGPSLPATMGELTAAHRR